MEAVIKNLHWYSDWNGYEVGFPHVDVVGLYTSHDLKADFYLNAEDGEVLEIIHVNEWE